MEEDKNRVTVRIDGNEYHLRGEDSPEHLEHIASLVNEKMKSIRLSCPSCGPIKLAVLTALQFADDKVKAEERYERMMREIDDLTSKY